MPETTEGPRAARAGRRYTWLLTLVAVLMVLVPFWFWHGTWFGRPLDDRKLERYLTETEKPRHIQHALSQIADRILAEDPTVERFQPRVRELAGHPLPEIRILVAWVLGQDTRSGEAPEILRSLLRDPEVMVRRNAALSLVRFGDEGGRQEILDMLRPYVAVAPAAGSLRRRLQESEPVNAGTLLGRVETEERQVLEIRSPVPGRMQEWLAADMDWVEPGDPVLRLTVSDEQAWEALRALVLIGRPEDLPDVQALLSPLAGTSEKIRGQASLTAEAIRRRSELHRPALAP